MCLRDRTEPKGLAAVGLMCAWDGISHAVNPKKLPHSPPAFYYPVQNRIQSPPEAVMLFSFVVDIVLLICFIFSSLVCQGRF